MVGDKIHDARDTAYIEGRRLREKKRREHFLLTVCSARAGIGAIFMAPNQSRAEQGHVRTCLRTHLNHTSPLLLLFAVVVANQLNVENEEDVSYWSTSLMG